MSTLDHRHDDEFEALAVGWALYSLEPDDAERFTAHLGTCPICPQVVAATEQSLADLAFALPDEQPPPELGERLRAAVAADPAPARKAGPGRSSSGPGGATTTDAVRSRYRRRHSVRPDGTAPAGAMGTGPGRGQSRPAQPRRSGRMRVALATLAVVLVAGLGSLSGVLYHQRNDARDSASTARTSALAAENRLRLAQNNATVLRTAVSHLVQPGPHTQITPYKKPKLPPIATVVDASNGIYVVSTGIPLNDQRSSIYVVWGIPPGAGAAPVPLGTFDVIKGEVNSQLMRPITRKLTYSTYALSKEPGRRAPTKPSDIIGAGTTA